MDKEKKDSLKEEKKSDKKKMDKKKLIFVAISGVVLVVLGLLVFKLSPKKNVLGIDEAKIKAENFINDNLMLPGTKATIKDISEEYGLYKLSIDLGSAGTGELIDSYISRDGELFFPQSININDYKNGSNTTSQEASEVSNKNNKPVIELFVMSQCPYGVQMEKGLIPVLEALGNSVDFTLKFNSYAMHDKVELDEEMTQYCIQKNDNNKLFSYLNCFVKSGDSNSCLKEAGIDNNSISKCVSDTDKEYKITEGYNDQSTWLQGSYPVFPIYEEDNTKYGVEGSPTLIINGEKVTANRDPQSLLTLVCSGFNKTPDTCQTQLSTEEPSYGFGK